MGDADLAIRAVGLGKQYRIGARVLGGPGTLRDAMAAGVRQFVRGGRARQEAPTVWALRDASFEVRRGEALGIVGANGAGKSTLLKLLARITEPTCGYADVRGRVGSLLEVGTGFHADLTGRENTYLNGAILGMRKAEIDRKFDEIVAFAEVERFIDTPVKHYSSGMYMRLAFAVAAHLDTEILLVDEVLAVGDTAFQRKCLGKMDDVTRHGRTVLFVSHNMEAIQRMCPQGIWIEQGRLAAMGPIGEVVSQYRAAHYEAAGGLGRFNPRSRSGTGWARVLDLALLDAASVRVGALPADADLRFQIDLELARDATAGASLRGLIVELNITSEDGRPLVSLMTADDDGVELPAARRCRLETVLSGPTFVPGRYRMNVFVGIPYLEHVDELVDALEFEILPPEHPWRPYALHERRGIVCRRAPWRCEVVAPELRGPHD
ncbi:MAG: ABC transporter ATP-binding protein [Acidobacteriota bacterium]|nr:ABC transporter ATP-binding protein [Acidobacteriota bacterium]